MRGIGFMVEWVMEFIVEFGDQNSKTVEKPRHLVRGGERC